MEQVLRTDFRLGDAPIAEALEYAVQDAGPIDLEEILSSGERKNPTPVRSKGSHRE